MWVVVLQTCFCSLSTGYLCFASPAQRSLLGVFGKHTYEKTAMRKVQIDSKRIIFDHFFKIEEATLRYEKFSGEMSRTIRRLNFERGNSVAALVLNNSTNKILMVNQFKYPTFSKGPGWITEIVAGAVDPGETHEDAIRREILEEMGYSTCSLEKITSFYVSPGGSSEIILLYFAEVDDRSKVNSGGGNPSEDEDIRIIEYTFPELWSALERNEFIDAKTLIAVMWLKDKLGANK
jgi:nudix-type nucleoside diphosphatase (YffH/AdpP family)